MIHVSILSQVEPHEVTFLQFLFTVFFFVFVLFSLFSLFFSPCFSDFFLPFPSFPFLSFENCFNSLGPGSTVDVTVHWTHQFQFHVTYFEPEGNKKQKFWFLCLILLETNSTNSTLEETNTTVSAQNQTEEKRKAEERILNAWLYGHRWDTPNDEGDEDRVPCFGSGVIEKSNITGEVNESVSSFQNGTMINETNSILSDVSNTMTNGTMSNMTNGTNSPTNRSSTSSEGTPSYFLSFVANKETKRTKTTE